VGRKVLSTIKHLDGESASRGERSQYRELLRSCDIVVIAGADVIELSGAANAVGQARSAASVQPGCDLSGYPIGSRETLTGTAALPYITGSSAAFNTKVTAAAEH